MATSSIRRNFVIEGQDAVDFANSLDDAIKEKEKRGPYKFDGKICSNEETKEFIERIFNKNLFKCIG